MKKRSYKPEKPANKKVVKKYTKKYTRRTYRLKAAEPVKSAEPVEEAAPSGRSARVNKEQASIMKAKAERAANQVTSIMSRSMFSEHMRQVEEEVPQGSFVAFGFGSEVSVILREPYLAALKAVSLD